MLGNTKASYLVWSMIVFRIRINSRFSGHSQDFRGHDFFKNHQEWPKPEAEGLGSLWN